MKSRAIKLQEITKSFRDTQRTFLQSMNTKLNESHKYIDIINVPDLSNVYDGFNQQQLEMIERKEKEANEREQAILEIAKSVHELAQLFQDLSILIVEQGSLIDRIDYNIEQTLEKLENTKPIIDDTNRYHRSSRATLCIIILIRLIVLMGFVLLLKHTL